MAFDGTLKFDTAIDQSGFKAGIEKLGSIAKSTMKLVTGAVAAASGAVSALGGYAVSVGRDFEAGMSQVIATMEITTDTVQDGVNSYELLKQAAADAGATTVFSASEAADALNYLALAGYDAAQAADALPAVLDLAAAGGLDLAYASDLATDAMAALGIEATSGNLTRFGDEMAKTASKANTSVAQLGEAILTVGGTAQTLAGGTTELNAALGVLANRGIKGAEGGTHLRNMILSLSAPTDTARAALDSLGVSALDANGNMRPLNETFADLDKALAGMSDGARSEILSDIFNKTDLAAAQGMLAGCGEEFDALAAEIENCDGAMAQMAATMNDNLEGDIKSLQSRLEAFGNAVYEEINEPLRELAQTGSEYLSRLTEAFNEGGFEGLAEALGDVLGDAVTKLAEYLPRLVELGASVITSLANGLLANIGTISGAAIRMIGTLADTLVKLAPKLLEAAAAVISELAQGLADNLPQIVETVFSLMTQLAEALTDNIEPMFDAVLEIIELLALSLMNNIGPLTDAVVDLIMTVADYISTHTDEIIDVAITVLASVAEALVENAPKLLAALTVLLGALLELVLEAAGKLLWIVIDYLGDIGTEIGESLANIIGDIGDWCGELIDKGIEAASGFLDSVCGFFEDLPGNIGEFLGDVTEDIGEWGKELLEKGKQAAKDLVDGIVTKVKELPDKMLDIGTDIIKGLWDGIKNSLDWLWDKVADFADSFVDSLKSVFHINSPSKLMRDRVGKNLALGIGEGFTEGMPDVSKRAADSLTDISRDAVRELNVQRFVMNSDIPQSTAISEIVNNSYETVNNITRSERGDISIHANLYVDGRLAASGSTQQLDEEQGAEIVLKGRGLAR